MPVRKVKGGYKWGNKPKKPTTKSKAQAIGRAAHASGYKSSKGK
jgi:hypothetical protein